MTMDNEEAEIVIAENIPYLTSRGRSTAEVDYEQYEFKDVGVTLKITPQINQERFVRLVIYQTIEQVVDQEEIGLPSTLKRQAETTVTIKDGHTIVIAGLIDETLTRGTYRVPCLGHVPVLSWLFKSDADAGKKTNLYFFVTPHIIENPVEASRVYEMKKGHIDTVKEGTVKMYEKRGRALGEIKGAGDIPGLPEDERLGVETPPEEGGIPEMPEGAGEIPGLPEDQEAGEAAPEAP
jgi:general secretion pathway protein D